MKNFLIRAIVTTTAYIVAYLLLDYIFGEMHSFRSYAVQTVIFFIAMCLYLLQVSYCYSLRLCVGDFVAGAFADVTADIDDEDLVSQVDLSLVHVIQHGLGTFCPYLSVTAMAEQTDGDDNVTFKC